MRILPLILAAAAATPALGQQVVFQLDPPQTQIRFIVDSTLHTVHGTFKLKQGTIQFDPSTGKMSGSVVVDVTSGETGNNGRNKKMHKTVLESRQYPEATFTPTQFTGKMDPNGKSDVQVQGMLNLHGTNHELTLPIHAERHGDLLSVKTHFVVPYVDWGMKSPNTFVLKVSNHVEVEIEAEGKVGRP